MNPNLLTNNKALTIYVLFNTNWSLSHTFINIDAQLCCSARSSKFGLSHHLNSYFVQAVKTLVRLHKCASWFKLSLLVIAIWPSENVSVFCVTGLKN